LKFSKIWLHLICTAHIRLGRITKQGDNHLRMLLIHGVHSELAALKDKQDHTSCLLRELVARRGYKRAAAAKNARIDWATLDGRADHWVSAGSRVRGGGQGTVPAAWVF